MALITSFYGQQDDTAPLFDGSYQSTTQHDPCAPPPNAPPSPPHSAKPQSVVINSGSMMHINVLQSIHLSPTAQADLAQTVPDPVLDRCEA